MDLKKKELEKMLENVGDLAAKKAVEALKNAKDAEKQNKHVSQKIDKQIETKKIEKSVIDKDNKKAPFVSLGLETKNFIQRIKGMVVKSSGQEAQTDELGGYTIPSELDAQIRKFELEDAIVRPRATVSSNNTGMISRNKLDQKTANVYGTVTYGFKGEGVAAAYSNAKMGQQMFVAKKLITLAAGTHELITSSDVVIANWLTQTFGDALNYIEDEYFLTGTGGEGQPQGIITDPSIQVVNRETANQISHDDVIDLKYAVRPKQRQRGVFVGSQSAIKYLAKIKDNDGRPLFLASAREGEVDMLAGRPALESEKLPNLGTKGDLFFGDLSAYFIHDKQGGMRVEMSDHVKFAEDEKVWKFASEFDGQPFFEESFAILDVPSA